MTSGINLCAKHLAKLIGLPTSSFGQVKLLLVQITAILLGSMIRKIPTERWRKVYSTIYGCFLFYILVD